MREERIDVWLSRISHFTQLGLFILAMAGLYFTVIPLYEKALLDEALAEKELRLKELDTKIAAMYTLARRTAVGQLVFAAGVDCSGLLTPPRPFLLIESLVTGKPYKPIPPEEMPLKFEDVVMNTSVKDCLGRHLAHQTLAVLRPEDRLRLEARMNEIGTAVDDERLKALPIFKRSSDDKRDAIAETLSERIRTAVSTLKDIEWQEAQSGVPADGSRPAGSDRR